MMLAILFRLIDAFLAVGSANRDYYRYFGVATTAFLSRPMPWITISSLPAPRRHRGGANFFVPNWASRLNVR